MGCNRLPVVLAIAAVTVLALAVPAHAAIITVLNTGSKVVPDTGSPGPANLENNTSTLSFDAGATADKLIVQLSSEKDTGPYSVSYNGDAFTLAVAGAAGRSADIWYLDNPYTGGAANLTVDMTTVGVVNGIGLGAVSIAGSLPGVAATASNGADNVTINTTAADSFVVAGHVSNGDGGVSENSPLVRIYAGSDIGSARGAAGYENGVALGASTYSFSGTGGGDVTVAAAFEPADDGRLAITDLFNTGVDGSGAALGDNVDDPHYDLIAAPDPPGLGDATVPSTPGSWVDNTSTSRWIGPDVGGNASAAPGDYTYRTTFTLDALTDLSSVIISGAWATDNPTLDIAVNGVSSGLSGGSLSFLTPFLLDSSNSTFMTGTNTIDFVVSNTGTGANPTGLLVTQVAGTYLLVPEPTTLLIWSLLAGLGVGLGWRRRK